jgi:hypothetical protein
MHNKPEPTSTVRSKIQHHNPKFGIPTSASITTLQLQQPSLNFNTPIPTPTSEPQLCVSSDVDLSGGFEMLSWDVEGWFDQQRLGNDDDEGKLNIENSTRNAIGWPRLTKGDVLLSYAGGSLGVSQEIILVQF